jgi:carbonic anhydrase
MTPDQILSQLRAGNRRFVRGERRAYDFVLRRAELLPDQKPLAVVVCCSDSRVEPVLLFDANLGDLFTIESAGNVVDDVGLGSIEFGLEKLDLPLVLVLGHTRCGAVTAACRQGLEAPGHMGAVLRRVGPAAAKYDVDIEAAIDENARLVRDTVLRESDLARARGEAGRLRIVAAVYHLETGEVHWLD